MIKNNVMGIVFTNSNDELLPHFTKKRSMASIPFGGRYRLIDFALSNFVNAGITKVGVITKSNYNSLLDHLGSGISWDLDRKNGGLFLLPPFSTSKAGFYTDKIDALSGVMTFLKRSKEDIVILCDSDIVSNIDIDKIISEHKKSNSGITVAYKNGELKNLKRKTLTLTLDEENNITEFAEAEESGVYDYAIDLFVINRKLLIDIISVASKYSTDNPSKQMLQKEIGEFKLSGYKVEDYAEIIFSKESYAEITMDLLKLETRAELFNKSRPVYTKTRDDMPSRYGVNAQTDNSLIAGGCIIEGCVKDSVIFRAVKIDKDTKISNSIIMQGAKIGKHCTLENVIIDKAAVISDGMTLIGQKDNYIYIEKEKVI